MKTLTKIAAVAAALVMVPVGAPTAQAAYLPVSASCYAEMSAVDSTGAITFIGIDGTTSPQALHDDDGVQNGIQTPMKLGYVPKSLTLVNSWETTTEFRYRYYALSTAGVLRQHVFVIPKADTTTATLTTKQIASGWTSVTDLAATSHQRMYTLTSTGNVYSYYVRADGTIGSKTLRKSGWTGLKGINYAGSVTTTVGGTVTVKRDLLTAITTSGAIKSYQLRYAGTGSDLAYTLKSSGYSTYETMAVGACAGRGGVMVLHDNNNGYARVLYDTNIINGVSTGELTDRGSLGVTWKFRSYGS